jgi:general secretion pathway protein D
MNQQDTGNGAQGAGADYGRAGGGAARGAANEDDVPGADRVAPGQDLVTIDFPEPTEIKDIIRAVAIWTGKNVILGKGVSGKVQMISPRRVTKEEAYQAFLSALNVLNLTTVETGKVIKIMPVRSAMKDNLQIYQGSGWAPQTDKLITQIVPLKYIDAKQVQATLSRIVSSNSIIAYSPTNTLIISDTGYKVRRILAIVELLDVQGQQPRLAIVPIRYGDAKDVSNKVSDILRTSGQVNKSSGMQAFKVSVDERSNSVIIFGPPRTIEEVKALVKKFDFPIDDPQNLSAIRVRFLDYADAKRLAGTLSSLAQGGSRTGRSRSIGSMMPPSVPNAARPLAGGGDSAASVADLGDNVKITADDYSNALLITGSRAAYQALNTLIRKLDRRRAQIYVEADILDVNVSNGFLFDTSIFAGTGKADGNKTIYGWEAGRMAPVMKAASGKATVEDGMGAIGALGSDFSIGVLSGKKFNLPGIGEISPGALIKMVKTDSNTRVLSSPHLTTSNNEEAKIKVGGKLFYKTAVQSGVVGLGSIEKVQYEDVDLTLKIKPNVSYSGSYVTLKVDVEANEGGIKEGLPDVNTRQSTQTVTLKDGQTAVISGLVKSRENEVYKKIPLLGDIPILGWLFRNTELTKQTTSLMIFITPHIVYGANDLARIYEDKVKERDELMAKAFGKDKDDEFNKKLPTLEEGRYKNDPYDQMEEANQKKFLEEIRAEAGYAPETAAGGENKPAASGEGGDNQDKGQKKGPSEEPITVPTDGAIDGGGGGMDMGPAPGVPAPLPPPPMMDGGYIPPDDGGGDFMPPEPPPPPEPIEPPSE